MDPKKLKIIQELPQPTNLHDLRSFICMYSYYRRFIEKSSIIAGPLHDLIEKKVKFQWTTRENNSFNELQKRLMSSPLF